MPRLHQRLCRRRLQGQRILSFVTKFDLDGNGGVSVTVARKYVAANKIKAPAIINIRRNKHTTDHYFLSEKGMFGLVYVEFNWMQFPCLVKLVEDLGYRELFSDMDEYDWSSEEESYRPEFSFI